MIIYIRRGSQSFFCLNLEYFLNDPVFVTINIDCFGYISTFLNNKLDFLFSWSSIYFRIISVYDTLYRLVISISSIICSSWNIKWLIFSCFLSSTWWFNSMKILLIKSSIIINTMLPTLLLKIKIIIEDILSI